MSNVIQFSDYKPVTNKPALPTFKVQFQGEYFVATGIGKSTEELLAAAADLRQAADILEAEARDESMEM